MGYQTGVHEADELTDGHLASVASLLLNLRAFESVEGGARHPAGTTARLEGTRLPAILERGAVERRRPRGGGQRFGAVAKRLTRQKGLLI